MYNRGLLGIVESEASSGLEDYHAGEIHTLVDGKIALGWWKNSLKPLP